MVTENICLWTLLPSSAVSSGSLHRQTSWMERQTTSLRSAFAIFAVLNLLLLASKFSSWYRPWIKHKGYENKGNDNQLTKLVGILAHVQRIAWRICILMLRHKELNKLPLCPTTVFSTPTFFHNFNLIFSSVTCIHLHYLSFLNIWW